jgi:putative ABC transport system substrate-binding protein
MRRRSFIATLSGVAAALPTFRTRAQARSRVACLLMAFDAAAPAVMLFRERLRLLGHVEGSTLDLTFRTANEPLQLPQLAAEIVASRPDVLVALNGPAADAFRSLTSTVPIVLVFGGDPIALGYSSSWSRPSGNVTGILAGLDTLSDKRVELLHEILPSARVFGLVYNPSTALNRLVLDRTRAAVQSLGLALQPYPVREGDDLAQIPARAAAAGVAALIVVPSPSIVANRAAFIAAATAHHLPTMHTFGFEAVDGAVVAYGIEQAENWQRAADYVHRLLQGEPVAALPFEQPAHVVLTVNLRAARAIGLEVPVSILARADEVIE